jgi:hypothetical protein
MWQSIETAPRGVWIIGYFEYVSPYAHNAGERVRGASQIRINQDGDVEDNADGGYFHGYGPFKKWTPFPD